MSIFRGAIYGSILLGCFFGVDYYNRQELIEDECFENGSGDVEDPHRKKVTLGRGIDKVSMIRETIIIDDEKYVTEFIVSYDNYPLPYCIVDRYIYGARDEKADYIALTLEKEDKKETAYLTRSNSYEEYKELFDKADKKIAKENKRFARYFD